MTRELRVVVLVLVIALPCSAATNSQGNALVDMKEKLNATVDQLSNWNPIQVNPCTWDSVICDNSNNVVQVTLAARGFNGVLSPRIGELQYLTDLDQDPGLRRMTEAILKAIEDRCRQEEEAAASAALAARPKLAGRAGDRHARPRSLAGNRITGSIPEQFGNLSSLTRLDLGDNLLVGEIPASLGKLSRLRQLTLSQNNLDGTIPESIANISSLQDIFSGQSPGLIVRLVITVALYWGMA
ncbi:hypothetical protein ACP4OV_012714 [Aristida adscensionis]